MTFLLFLYLLSHTTTGLIRSGTSELVKVFTMGEYNANIHNPTGQNCPHAQSGLTAFSATQGADITITGNVLLTATNIQNINSKANPFGIITIQSGSQLIFDGNNNIELHVKEIRVYGKLIMGSETCRLQNKINIYFHGSRTTSSLSNDDLSKPSKGIYVFNQESTIELHGKQYHPTWTRLAYTVNKNDNEIILQDKVNWEINQEIVIITSSFYDCPLGQEWPYCYQCYEYEKTSNHWKYTNVTQCHAYNYYNDSRKRVHQNEVRKITQIQAGTYGNIITLNESLNYVHYAGNEYQIEVGLLSRNIKLEGIETNDLYGGHLLATGGSLVQISGVQTVNFGQRQVLGRYPFHMHLQGDATNSYFTDNSVVNSNWRAYVLHGTNYMNVERNIAYSVRGMAYYNEDGVEENNIFKYNLAAHIHFIYKSTEAYSGQGGDTYDTIDGELMLPFDTTASGFYIPNAYNTYIGNAASGGWSGYAFPNLPQSIGVHWNSSLGIITTSSLSDTKIIKPDAPLRRPTKEFNGNTAHSAGFYWKGHGNCIYSGGWLNQKTTTTWNYVVGRAERRTRLLDGSEAFMIFNNTKVWLCARGVTHWGDRIKIENYEAYDIMRGAELFGKASIFKSIIQARTKNINGWYQQEMSFYNGRTGFQFYDTWVQTILSHITFRNYTQFVRPNSNSIESDYIVIYMTHSDQFLPQGINSVKALKFEYCNLTKVIKKEHCGKEFGCDENDYETQSGRIYAVWDYDGSYSLSQRKSIIGSWRDWWYINDNTCEKTIWGMYRCDWLPSRTIGFMSIYVPGLHGGCSNNLGSCTGQKSSYTVGTVSHFGLNNGNKIGEMPIGPWSGVAGYSNMGWYYAPKFPDTFTNCPNCKGSPSLFYLGKDGGYNLPRGHFIIYSMRYPTSAQFSVSVLGPSWVGKPAMPLNMSTYEKVTSIYEYYNASLCIPKPNSQYWELCESYGNAIGPSWYFDNTNGYLYIRVVNPALYTKNYRLDPDTRPENWFHTVDDVTVWSMNGLTWEYKIEVTSCIGCTQVTTYNNVIYYKVDDVPPSSLRWSWLDEALEPSSSLKKSVSIVIFIVFCVCLM